MPSRCRDHKQLETLFCHNCSQVCCFTCYREKHLQHRIEDLDEAFESKMKELRVAHGPLLDIIDSFAEGLRIDTDHEMDQLDLLFQ